MTLFSLSAFASFNEYDGNYGNFGSPVNNTGAMTAGGNFWSTNVSAMVDRNGVVTNNFDYYSPRYYVGSGGNTQQQDNTNWQTAPSIMDYVKQPGDVFNMYWLHENLNPSSPLVLDANGNAQFGFIVTKDASIMQPVNEYSGYTPQQINNAIMGIGNYDPNPSTRPRFGYNEYTSSNNTNTVKIYEVSPNGPVLVSQQVIVTYNAIPRVGVLGFTAQPSPEFYAAAQLSSKTSFTLAETATYIEKYIDRVFADTYGPGGRVAQIESAIAKLVKGLPDQQKWQAKDLLITYITARNKYPDMTEAQFENWFLGKPEGIDGDYDAAYWENPNLTFPQQNLPTYNDYLNGMPRFADGSFMKGADNVYGLVGGAVQQARIANPISTANTCALKVSIALNKAGVVIPNLPGKTLEGSGEFAGKYFFLNAKSLNSWMRETFGTNPENVNHFSYTSSDGGAKGINFPEKLKDKKGIYSMITTEKYTKESGISGHADLIFNGSSGKGTCIFGCSFSLPVERIDIWILN
nr:T6SS effector amidase Tae4 family protein [uncultured Flavobacterium sp.]